MDIPLIEQIKIQAQVLVPLVKALQAELGEERANALVRKALGKTSIESSGRRRGERRARATSGRKWRQLSGKGGQTLFAKRGLTLLPLTPFPGAGRRRVSARKPGSGKASPTCADRDA
jgi:hypothetical protein